MALEILMAILNVNLNLYFLIIKLKNIKNIRELVHINIIKCKKCIKLI